MCCITFWHQKLAVNVAARCETNDTQSQKPKFEIIFSYVCVIHILIMVLKLYIYIYIYQF